MKFHKNLSMYFSIFFILLSTIFFLSLSTHHQYDCSFFYYDDRLQTQNLLGPLGAYVSALLFFIFGGVAYYLTGIIFLMSLLSLVGIKWINDWDQRLAAFMILPSLSVLAAYYQLDLKAITPGGLIGQQYMNLIRGSSNLELFIGFVHIILLASILVVTRLSLVRPVNFLAQTQWVRLLKYSMHLVMQGLIFLHAKGYGVWQRYAKNQDGEVVISADDLVWAALENFEMPVDDSGVFDDPFWKTFGTIIEETNEELLPPQEEFIHKLKNEKEVKPVLPQRKTSGTTCYRVPPISLLATGNTNPKKQDEELKLRAQIVEEKLARFGVKGEVVSITPGPVVTLFEFQPAIDIKVSRILALEDDLALALKAHSLRIIAPIPGKSVVGFEVANITREILYLAPLIDSKTFKNDTSHVPIVLGHDTVGAPIIIDVAAAPHLLIAGSTGSGKSVALNVMLTSMLYRRTPEELRLVLIDPKRLEFAAYADIPHLLCPIITHPSKAVLVLKWVLKTMEERYECMADVGVRNILDYKQWCGENGEKDDMPFIVVMIDELADLMLVAGGDIEDLLARISQMARAAGIHLIVATQRPSVDVITGVVKVNFPSRIAFKVASKIDSRTILDSPGAEKLLGKGDMLYLAPHGSLSRLHGAYITAQEIARVVDHVKKESPVVYSINLDEIKSEGDGGSEEPLYSEVVTYVKSLEEISISHLQRKFRIGYNRSARIIDLLETNNVIMPADGGKMRKVIH